MKQEPATEKRVNDGAGLPASKTSTHAFCDDALGKLDAVALAQCVARQEVSALELVEAAVARANKIDHQLNAIVTPNYARAKQDAKANPFGPFGGVPIFIKDTDDVKGVPTRYGSRAMPIQQAKRSSDLVHMLDIMGMISLGKASMPEFGLTGTTEPKLHSPTRNPWHIEHSVGGSSGGSAALVAAGVVPIAHANDGGGSTRIPAACCGLVGFKPTRNRLGKIAQTRMLPIKIACHGIVSRSVRDTATFYGWAEKFYHDPALPAVGLVRGPAKQRLRIGFFSTWDAMTEKDPQVMRIVEHTASLCESLGHQVESIAVPYSAQLFDDFIAYWGLLAFSVKHLTPLMTGQALDKTLLENFTHSLSDHFLKNIWKMPGIIKRLKGFQRTYQSYFEDYDVLLSPVTGHAAPQIGHLDPDLSLEETKGRLSSFVPFTCPQNISGAPAVSLPMGRCALSGLPIGVQLAAPFGEDKRLLELAFELEAADPWPLLCDVPK